MRNAEEYDLDVDGTIDAISVVTTEYDFDADGTLDQITVVSVAYDGVTP